MDLPVQAPVGRRVGQVDAGAEHGDRGTGLQRASVRGAVDPKGHPAYDEEAGGGKVAPELSRDLTSVAAGPPGADQRHGVRASDALQDPVETEPEQAPGGVPRIGERSRVEIAVRT